jgi:hypothetical protein
MGQLVVQHLLARGRRRPVGALAEHHVVADDEGVGIEPGGSLGRGRAGVDAHVAEVGAEGGLEHGAGMGVEGVPRLGHHLRGRGHRGGRRGGVSLHPCPTTNARTSAQISSTDRHALPFDGGASPPDGTSVTRPSTCWPWRHAVTMTVVGACAGGLVVAAGIVAIITRPRHRCVRARVVGRGGDAGATAR